MIFEGDNDGLCVLTEMCNILSAHHEDEDLQAMLVRLNDRMAEAYEALGYNDHGLQMCYTTDKKVYFQSSK